MMIRRLRSQPIIFDQAIVSAGNFFSAVLLARILGLEDFGIFTVAWLVVLFTSSLVMAVIAFPMLSTCPLLKSDERPNYITGCITTFCILAFFWLILCLGLYLFLTNYYETQYERLIIPLSLCVIAVHFQEICRRALIVLEKHKQMILTDSITYGVRILLITLLPLTSNASIEATLWLFVASSILGVLPCKNLYKTQGNILSLTKKAWGRNKESAKWLLPSGIMQWTSINLFISAAPVLISPSSAAMLRVCQSLLSVVNVLFQGLENIIPVKASQTYQNQGAPALRSYLLSCAIWGTPLCLALFFTALIWGKDILSAVYGPEYREASSILTLYSLSYLFVYWIIPIRGGLRTIGQTKIWFYAYLLSSIVSLSLVYFLETQYSLTGAVLGILIAYIVLVGFSALGLKKSLTKNLNYDC